MRGLSGFSGFGIGMPVGAMGNSLPAAPFASVAASGWEAVWSGTPSDLDLQSVYVDRAGYSTSASATTHRERLYTTKRVRQLYPSNASFTDHNQALSEYVCAADTLSGAVNNSTKVSPKVIMNWVMPHGYTVGDTVQWEIVAFHWAAGLGGPQQVACVRVRATDGTNYTAWQTVTAPTLSTLVEDARPCEVYAGTLDISGLNNPAMIHLEGEGYPWVGTAASVRTSAASNDPRIFAKRHFYRNVTLAASPPYVYVASTGNDSTGVCSTTAATAAASPCLTVQGAIVKAKAALAGNYVDGLHIRIVDTVAFGSTPAAETKFKGGAVIIERAPGTARGAAIVQQSAAVSFRLGATTMDAALTYAPIIFSDVSIQRTASGQLGNSGTPYINAQLWNVAFDNGSVAGAYVATNCALSQFGVTWGNATTTSFSYSANAVQPILRGVVATFGGGSYEAGLVMGCTITAMGLPTHFDATKGAIWYNNSLPNPSSTNSPIRIAPASAGQDIGGFAIVGNLIESIHTTSTTPAVRPSGDGENGNITHAVIHHNVGTGAYILARWNLAYDETVGTVRTHDFVSMKGNIFPQWNTKGDVFIADASHNGNQALIHGVGCEGVWTTHEVQTVALMKPAYGGVNSSLGTSTSVMSDPGFVTYAGSTYNGSVYSAGAGGGDYRLTGGAPARDIVSRRLTRYDFAGAERAAGTQDAGLYA